MKQFDWMREQIEAKAFRQGFSNDVLVKVEDVGNIIDEAEAKWESEVCGWKRDSVFNFFIKSPHEGVDLLEEELKLRHYCPGCGKPIKIVEVE